MPISHDQPRSKCMHRLKPAGIHASSAPNGADLNLFKKRKKIPPNTARDHLSCFITSQETKSFSPFSPNGLVSASIQETFYSFLFFPPIFSPLSLRSLFSCSYCKYTRDNTTGLSGRSTGPVRILDFAVFEPPSGLVRSTDQTISAFFFRGWILTGKAACSCSLRCGQNPRTKKKLWR